MIGVMRELMWGTGGWAWNPREEVGEDRGSSFKCLLLQVSPRH